MLSSMMVSVVSVSIATGQPRSSEICRTGEQWKSGSSWTPPAGAIGTLLSEHGSYIREKILLELGKMVHQNCQHTVSGFDKWSYELQQFPFGVLEELVEMEPGRVVRT